MFLSFSQNEPQNVLKMFLGFFEILDHVFHFSMATQSMETSMHMIIINITFIAVYKFFENLQNFFLESSQ